MANTMEKLHKGEQSVKMPPPHSSFRKTYSRRMAPLIVHSQGGSYSLPPSRLHCKIVTKYFSNCSLGPFISLRSKVAREQ